MIPQNEAACVCVCACVRVCVASASQKICEFTQHVVPTLGDYLVNYCWTLADCLRITSANEALHKQNYTSTQLCNSPNEWSAAAEKEKMSQRVRALNPLLLLCPAGVRAGSLPHRELLQRPGGGRHLAVQELQPEEQQQRPRFRWEPRKLRSLQNVS